MNNKKFFLIGGIIVAIGVSVYAWLGGFSKPEITEVTTSELYVAGKDFKGSMKSEELGKLFQEVGKLVEEKALPGEFGNIMYNNPDENNDSLHAFIGTIAPAKNVKLPAGYEVRTVPAGQKALRVQLNAHYMLSPGKVYEAAFDYAKEHKLTTQNFFVERFPDSHKADFLIFLK